MKIDPEFKALIPPPTPAERDALRADIIRQGGARDPLVLWAGEILLDGHNRYEICTELGLPFKTINREFADRDAAKAWILSNQMGRRNLTPDQILMISAMRGVEPPAAFRNLPGLKIAQELVAANFDTSKVLSGKWTLRVAQFELRKARGEIKPKQKAVPTFDETLAAGRLKREDSLDKKQLKEAFTRIEQLQATVSRLSAPAPQPSFSVVRHLGSSKRQAWGLSLMSDIHAGALVEPTASVCFNEYNPDICRSSLDRYFESIPWLIKDEPSFDVVGHCLWLGGDLIDGQLHDDQTETSEAPLVTINWLEPFLMGRLEALASELGDRELRIMCSYGNHGRDTVKPRNETGAEHSHEWALYQRLARHFATHRTIRVYSDKARDQYTKLFDFTIHGTHGDTVRSNGGIGGITIPMRKAYATWQQIHPSYLHLTGHFHTQLDLGDGLANGSGVGYNAFARKINARPEAPQQIFCLIDSKRGKTKVSPIWMRDLDNQERAALAQQAHAWDQTNT
jgi:hypothetical protein